jgi:hypothetical protein
VIARLAAGAVVIALAAPAGGSDGAPPRRTVYSLPRFSTPQRLALGGDGSLRMTASVERRTADGHGRVHKVRVPANRPSAASPRRPTGRRGSRRATTAGCGSAG